MPRSPARFTQADVTRAVKAAVASGLTVGRIEIDHEGRIIIEAKDGKTAAPIAAPASLAEWRERRRGKG